ncbi:trk system potassium uptake protein TrkA [Methanolobus vulcani]|jgi:trk system potassium uptake protein TrkA|uniref:Trk system potassium uptake protein TrkA n=1 Tax=Methanolobus vulcani TaxID=38026 RepID=A0A7Z7FE93_9EURY|nr:TrkA family potassium uptake protein [Methanolobus vulcani]SDF74957.1 trk system potassium uptake protein TrkA [Methanolobus vulcani]
MRVIVVGAGSLGILLTKNMIDQGKEVILIEKDEAIAKELAETLDCTVINAEGTRPDILEKADLSSADAIVACTSNDQNNILIGLIARDAKVGKIILKIEDKQFMDVANKLGFYYMINPSSISSRYIADVLRGINTIELSNLVRSEVRFMGIVATESVIDMKLSEISLPEDSAIIGIYRKNEFILAAKDPKLREKDEVIIVTKADFIQDVNEAMGRNVEE